MFVLSFLLKIPSYFDAKNEKTNEDDGVLVRNESAIFATFVPNKLCSMSSENNVQESFYHSVYFRFRSSFVTNSRSVFLFSE